MAMNPSHRNPVLARRALLLAGTTSLLAACGGGGYGGGSAGTPMATSRYAVTLLLSDEPGDGLFNAQLTNPWDFAAGGGSAVWITNNGSAGSTAFNAGDPSLPLLVIGTAAGSSASARPTAAAFNPANGFEVTSDGRTGVARFIVASEGGTLAGFAPSLGIDRLVVAFDGSTSGAVYSGLAMTPQGVESTLLAVDFRNGVIDTFGADFVKQPAGDRFVDPTLPAGYAPFGIAVHGGLIYLTYAKPNASAHLPQTGAGLGLVNLFDSAGRLIRRVISPGSALNAPWSVALAPADFGALDGALLVANSGDGTISAFDSMSGRSLGPLTGPDGALLVIDGLHRIAFGSGALGQATNALFFTAGPHGGTHGRYGRIDPQ
jgi:uncharacterized protein (TIGR03118 family)